MHSTRKAVTAREIVSAAKDWEFPGINHDRLIKKIILAKLTRKWDFTEIKHFGEQVKLISEKSAFLDQFLDAVLYEADFCKFLFTKNNQQLLQIAKAFIKKNHNKWNSFCNNMSITTDDFFELFFSAIIKFQAKLYLSTDSPYPDAEAAIMLSHYPQLRNYLENSNKTPLFRSSRIVNFIDNDFINFDANTLPETNLALGSAPIDEKAMVRLLDCIAKKPFHNLLVFADQFNFVRLKKDEVIVLDQRYKLTCAANSSIELKTTTESKLDNYPQSAEQNFLVTDLKSGYKFELNIAFFKCKSSKPFVVNQNQDLELLKKYYQLSFKNLTLILCHSGYEIAGQILLSFLLAENGKQIFTFSIKEKSSLRFSIEDEIFQFSEGHDSATKVMDYLNQIRTVRPGLRLSQSMFAESISLAELIYLNKNFSAKISDSPSLSSVSFIKSTATVSESKDKKAGVTLVS